jgi:VWFA-related protein
LIFVFETQVAYLNGYLISDLIRFAGALSSHIVLTDLFDKASIYNVLFNLQNYVPDCSRPLSNGTVRAFHMSCIPIGQAESSRCIMETSPSIWVIDRTSIGRRLWQVLELFMALIMLCQVSPAQDCPQCSASLPPEPPLPTGLWLLTTQVNEVNVLFSATHKGKAIGDLSRDDVLVQDDNKPPAAVLGFRTEQELVLRVGVAIDTSSSLTSRFRFEQAAASAFFHQVLTRPGDLGFVMGFENYPTVTQDFVGDPNLLSQGVERLKVGGGTALYDAVRTACQKMVHREEQNRVARVLVVLSDGQNNAGTVTLERAIDAAQEADVLIYAISTNYNHLSADNPGWETAHAGDTNLRKLAEESGGRLIKPNSPNEVAKAFAKIGDELRSRYSVSYKPADFRPDGRYRRIKIEAHKLGEKLEIRARKGYYARSVSSLSADLPSVASNTTIASR